MKTDARKVDAREREIGRRIRARRMECRLSQNELAKRIGVTLQQVQKYEGGANRIGAGRLERISEALDVPVAFFFTEDEAIQANLSGETHGIFQLAQSPETVRLLKAMHKIKGREMQQLLIALAEAISREESVRSGHAPD